MGVFSNRFWQVSFLLFAVHQVTQKVLHIDLKWVDSYLDPLLCMPIFLGFILAERRFVLKKWKTKTSHNNIYTFSNFELVVLVLTFSLIFEEGFPLWSNSFTKDFWDYIFYAIGGVGFHYFVQKN